MIDNIQYSERQAVQLFYVEIQQSYISQKSYTRMVNEGFTLQRTAWKILNLDLPLQDSLYNQYWQKEQITVK